MIKPELLFYLRKDATTYYKAINNNTGFTETTTATVLADPSDWNNLMVSYRRFKDFPGIVRGYTAPLRFVLDGKAILDGLYSAGGVMAVCYLYVERLNDTTQEYEPYIDTRITFSQYKKYRDFTEVQALEGGLYAKVKAVQDTVVTVPIEDSDCVKGLMDGVMLQGNYYWSVGGAISTPYGVENNQRLFPPLPFLNYETMGVFSKYVNGTNQESNIGDPNGSAFLSTNIDVSGTFNFSMNINVGVSGFLGPQQFKVYILREKISDSSISSAAIYTYPGSLGGGTNTNVKTTLLNQALVLSVGYRYYLFMRIEGFEAPQDCSIQIHDLKFEFSFTDRIPQSVTKGYRPHQVLNKVLSKATDNQYTAKHTALTQTDNKDEYFGAIPYYTLIASGDAVRALDGATLKTSLTHFGDYLQTVHNIGLGIENEKMIAERLEYFYDDTKLIYDFEDSIIEAKVTPATELMGSSLKVGYTNQEYEDVNGKDEVNTTYVYNTPIDTVPGELDVTTTYRADPYGIEFTRANLAGKNTTDNSSDNEVFIIGITNELDSTTGAYKLYRGGTILAGFKLTPSYMYNLAFFPPLNLLRRASYYKSIFGRLANKVLKYRSTDKNWGLIYRPSGQQPIVATKDIDFSQVGGRQLFRPDFIEFKVKIPKDLHQRIENNKYGVIRGRFEGKRYEGYIYDIGEKASGDAYNVKLLMSMNSDI